MTPIDHADMSKSVMTTILAGHPMASHMLRGSKLTGLSCNSSNPQTCTCKNILVLLRVEFRLLLTQSEIDIDLRHHFHGLAIEQRGFVLPLRNGLARGFHQQRVAVDQSQILNGAVLADDRGEVHHALNTGGLGERR